MVITMFVCAFISRPTVNSRDLFIVSGITET